MKFSQKEHFRILSNAPLTGNKSQVHNLKQGLKLDKNHRINPLCDSRYENYFLSLNHMVYVAGSVEFDSPK